VGARGVFEYVTRPCVATVVTGTRPDGTVHSGGLVVSIADDLDAPPPEQQGHAVPRG
jgi:hypothetical protein